MACGDRRQRNDQPVPQEQSVVRAPLSDQEAERLSKSKWKMGGDSVGWAPLVVAQTLVCVWRTKRILCNVQTEVCATTLCNVQTEVCATTCHYESKSSK